MSEISIRRATSAMRASEAAGVVEVCFRGLLSGADMQEYLSALITEYAGAPRAYVMDSRGAVWPTRSQSALARLQDGCGGEGGALSVVTYVVCGEVLSWYRRYALVCANEGVVCGAFTSVDEAQRWARQRFRALVRQRAAVRSMSHEVLTSQSQ